MNVILLRAGTLLLLAAVASDCQPKAKADVPWMTAEFFVTLIHERRTEILEEDGLEAYWLKFAGARSIAFATGKTGILALLHGRPAACGTGLHYAGIEGSDGIVHPPGLESILVLSPDGLPLYQVANGRSRLCPFDTDGDGLPDVLIRWNSSFEHGRPPFVTIHDLTRPGLPAMVSVSLNLKATEDLTMRLLGGECPELPKGRWRLETNNDLVLESERKEAARFRLDPLVRRWVGPAGDPDGFWEPNPDVWAGASFTDYTIANRR